MSVRAKLMIYNIDCMEFMKKQPPNSYHTILTDIPYGEVSRDNNGLSCMKNSQLGSADEMGFDLNEFLKEVYRLATDNIIIFCGKGQFSKIHQFFDAKKGTVRQLIYEKTNPVPSNGRYVYLSGIENAVWFRKPGGTFNAYCKNTVFRYPIQQPRIHKTEKNHLLLEELLKDNTNEGDTIFDPCMGSGSTGLAVYRLGGREFVGCELDKESFLAAKARFNKFGYELESDGE